MITLHAVGATKGIDYLLSTVVTADRTVGKLQLPDESAQPSDSPGIWVGRGARWLGLKGEVSYADASALFRDGRGPDGELLGARWIRTRTVEQYYRDLLAREPEASAPRRAALLARAERAGKREARTGWELVLSPVKSLSVLWALASDAERAILERIEQEAFAAILERLENEAAWVVTGSQKVQELGDGLIGAVFTHRSSRSGDPLLHRHLTVSAKVPFGQQWLALDARPLHRLMVSLSEQYHAEIERGMARYLGILASLRPRGLGAERGVREFAGVSDALVRGYSSRHEAIGRDLAQRTRTQAATLDGREPTRRQLRRLAQDATLATRPPKQPRSAEDERREWLSKAPSFGHQADVGIIQAAIGASASLQNQPDIALHEIPALVVARLEADRGIYTRPHAHAETIRQLVEHGWHIALGEKFQDRIERLSDAALAEQFSVSLEAPEPVELPAAYRRADGSAIFKPVASARYTTHGILAAEAYILAHAGHEEPGAHLDAPRIREILDAGRAERGFAPSDEQLAAVTGLFHQPRRIEAVIGRAGTGKTALMRMIGEVARAEGRAAIGLARSQLQATNLSAAAGIRAENTAKWLHHSSAHATDPNWRLPPGAIVVLDEAAQTSTLDIAALLTQVQAVNGRLILVGDPRQLGAIGSGGILAHLENGPRAFHLTENRRFRTPNGGERIWESQAAEAVSVGHDQESFDAYQMRGRIHASTGMSLAEAITGAYLSDLDEHLVSILIAPDNDTAADLAARVRAKLIARGVVRIDTAAAELADGNQACPGDIIETRRNAVGIRPTRRLRPVANGDLWRVERTHDDGSITAARLSDGAIVRLDAHYLRAHAGLGYAVTKDRAQGITVDTAHTLVTDTFTRNALYPAITRGRWANHIYLDTGQIPDELTAREMWRSILEREAPQLTATAVAQRAREHTETLATLVSRLRHALGDLLDERIRLSDVHLGPLLPTFPAWPALRTRLLMIEAAGIDAAEALSMVIDKRELASADDPAAVLHWRLGLDRRFRDALYPEPAAPDPDEMPLPPVLISPALDVLRELRLRDRNLDGADPDKTRYATELEELIAARDDAVTQHALAMARAGEGWCAAYGPEPGRGRWLEDMPRLEWIGRVTAAAQYRDLVGYREAADPVGPAPADPALRRLWRYAQPPADPAALQAEAVLEAEQAWAWLDELGPVPSPSSSDYEVWMVAYESTSAYRRMWDYQREDRAVGPRPVEPVQRLDWEIARADIAALNLADTPARVTADGSEQLRALAAEGDLAAQILGDIRDADDALFTARITALGAEQAAADALVRARIARRDGRTDAAVLIDRADQASKDADLAQAALTQAQDALRTRTAAGPAMRERARLAMAAAGEVERRTKSGETGLGWREREFGRLPDGRLEAAVAAARASTAAIRSQLEHITAQTSGPASRFPGLAPTAADAERLEAQAVYLRAVLDQTQAQVEGFEREARIRLNVAPGRREAEQSARAVIATASSAPQSRPEPVHEQNGDLISSAVDSAGHALT